MEDKQNLIQLESTILNITTNNNNDNEENGEHEKKHKLFTTLTKKLSPRTTSPKQYENIDIKEEESSSTDNDNEYQPLALLNETGKIEIAEESEEEANNQQQGRVKDYYKTTSLPQSVEYNDGDEFKGIFYQMGLKRSVESKVLMESYPKVEEATDLRVQSIRLDSRSIPNAWFSIDFIRFKVDVSYFQLKTDKGYSLISFDFEGTNDDKEWYLISRHQNEPYDEEPKTKTFIINKTETRTYFRKFRIKMTGRNSSDDYTFYSKGFDIYGHVKALEHDEDDEEQKQKHMMHETRIYCDRNHHLNESVWIRDEKTVCSVCNSDQYVSRGECTRCNNIKNIKNCKTKKCRGKKSKKIKSEYGVVWYCDYCSETLESNGWQLDTLVKRDGRVTFVKVSQLADIQCKECNILIKQNEKFYSCRHIEETTDCLSIALCKKCYDKITDLHSRFKQTESEKEEINIMNEEQYTITIHQRPPFNIFNDNNMVIKESNLECQINDILYKVNGKKIKQEQKEEIKEEENTINNINIQKEFIYKTDLDENGIIYGLGTEFGKTEWKNPAALGLIKIMSSDTSGNKDCKLLIERNIEDAFYSPNKEGSFFMIDFTKDIQIKPTHYTLKNPEKQGSSYKYLRSWNLEASNDGLQWTIISEHKNDKSLTKKGQSKTWKIQQNDKFFKFNMFRIRMTGENSGNNNSLSCCGFEIYGTLTGLYHKKSKEDIVDNDDNDHNDDDDDNDDNDDISNVFNYQSLPFNATFIRKKQKEEKNIIHYQSDFDENGIIHGLATNFGKTKWINPATLGLIKITSSGWDEGKIDDVVGTEIAAECWSKNKEGSWFMIDFTDNININPTHYTLRHHKSDKFYLRSWNLEASNDGLEWKTIDQHKQDESLSNSQDSKTWKIQENDEFFNMFRIRMTGKNSDNSYCLSCCGFEIYGALDADFIEPSKYLSETKKYESDFDKNGICYFLGCNYGEEKEWQNPAKRGIIKVSSSSIKNHGYRWSRYMDHIVGRESVECSCWPRMFNEPIQWIQIDFQSIKIQPTHYTLKHSKTHDGGCLRDWIFEASNDGINWFLLKQHENDKSLQAIVQSFTWELDENIDGYYSKFRLRMKKDSYGRIELACSGFEIYGDMICGLYHQKLKEDDVDVDADVDVDDSEEEKVMYAFNKDNLHEDNQQKIEELYSSFQQESSHKIELLEYEDFIRFIPLEIEDWQNGEANNVVSTSYNLFQGKTNRKTANKITDYEYLHNFRAATNIIADDDEFSSRSLLNYTFLYNLCYHVYGKDIRGLSTSNIYFNYYFDKQHNNLMKQIFIGFVQIVFAIALIYYVYGIVEEQQISWDFEDNHFVKNLLFTILVYYLVCSKVIPSVKYYRADIKVLKQYFNLNNFNVSLGMITNVFIAIVVPVITLFIILTSETVIDIVLNSTAVIFVIDLDDEATDEIDYEEWFTVKNRNFNQLFTKHFSLNDKCFDIEKNERINSNMLNALWNSVKNNVDQKEESVKERVQNHLMNVGNIIFFPFILLYESVKVLWFFVEERCAENKNKNNNVHGNDNNAKENKNEIGSDNDHETEDIVKINEIANQLVVDGKLNEAIQKYPVSMNNKSKNDTDFVYEYDFDSNGIIQNLQQYVTITCYPKETYEDLERKYDHEETFEEMDVRCIIGGEYRTFMLKQTNDAWIEAKFDEAMTIKATHYSIRDGHWSNHLRNWVFEAINDDTNDVKEEVTDDEKEEWIVLSEHENDGTLANKGDIGTWNIVNDGYYNRFRIRITGLDSSNESNYLSICALEIYGNVRNKNENEEKEDVDDIDGTLNQIERINKTYGEESAFAVALWNNINANINKANIENKLVNIINCNPQKRLKDTINIFNILEQNSDLDKIQVKETEINVLLNTYQFESALNAYKSIGKNFGYLQNKMEYQKKEILDYTQKQMEKQRNVDFVMNNFGYFLSRIAVYGKDKVFEQNVVETMKNKLKAFPENIEMLILLLQINKILLYQTKKNELSLIQQIKDEYGVFYKFIYDECGKLNAPKIENLKQNIELMENNLKTIKMKKNGLKDEINDNLHTMNKLSPFYAMFYDQDYSKKEGIKDGIQMFSKHINSHPKEAYFYFMRAICKLRNNDLEKALKDFHKAIALQPKNGIFIFYVGFVEDKLSKKENAMIYYKNGWKLLYEMVGKHYYHALQSKIYLTFFKYAAKSAKNKIQSFIIDVKTNIYASQKLSNLFANEHKSRSLSISKVHEIVDEEILNELEFYRLFELKLMEWFKLKKFFKNNDNFEVLNGFLFECRKEDELWNIKPVLNETLEQRSIDLSPPFYRVLVNKYYDVTEMYENTKAEVIAENIKLKCLAFNDLEKTSTKQNKDIEITKAVDFKNDETVSNEEIEFVKLEYGPLLNERDRKNADLLKCIAFGQKQKIPLLQYYSDAKYRLALNMNVPNIEHKIMREILFNQTGDKSDKYGLENAFQFYEQFGAQTNENITIKIWEPMRYYFDYICAILQLFKTKYASSFPMQFDLYILPKSILHGNESERVDIKIKSIFDQNKILYIEKRANRQLEFNVLFEMMMTEFLNKLHCFDANHPLRLDVNAPKERRICFVIDHEHQLQHSTFYLYKPKSGYKFSKYDLSEFYFVRSSRSIISVRSFGILFTSFHFKAARKIQIYQYWNKNLNERVGGRFLFEHDVKGVWKKYFKKCVDDDDDDDDDLPSESCEVDDDDFEKWFQDKTKEFRECNYNLKQLRIQRNAN